MLTEACKLYLESEYIVAALRSLANFTYNATMPYLNCIERSNQDDLVNILKQLFADLKEGKMDTLRDFHVPWTHVDMTRQEPVSSLDQHLLQIMCQNAANGIQMQCASEYWAENPKPRATQLHRLTQEERKNIPTENMEAERYLTHFGYLASVSAAKSNRFFKANRIRDDMMFQSSLYTEEEVSRATKRIIKNLNEMEVDWTKEQWKAWKIKVEAGMNKKARALEYKDLLLAKCKEHQGPFVNVKEANASVKKTPEEALLKRSVRQEIWFQKLLHPVDARERSHLYKMNFLSGQELVENLIILLDHEISTDEGEIVCFPTEEEIMHILKETQTKNPIPQSRFVPQQPVAVVWYIDDDRSYWCLGFFLDQIDKSTCRVDHLESKDKVNWYHPAIDDIQVVNYTQILPCNVDGEWNFVRRQSAYIIKNIQEIDLLFKNNYICQY